MLYSYHKGVENGCVSSSWHTSVCPSTLAMSNAVFPSCVKYNIQYNSDWLLSLNRHASSSFYVCMDVPCWIWVWYLQGTIICEQQLESWQNWIRRRGVETRGKALPTNCKINELLESLDLLPVEAWNSFTQWTGSHRMYVPVFLPNSSVILWIKAWFTLLVRFTLAPCLISFLTIPTFPFLAALMSSVSCDSWDQNNNRNTNHQLATN